MPILIGCQKEAANLTVSPSEITLYAEGTKAITTNASNATFTSEDDYYAEVDESGLVTANKVGNTKITVSGNISTSSATAIPLALRPTKPSRISISASPAAGNTPNMLHSEWRIGNKL